MRAGARSVAMPEPIQAWHILAAIGAALGIVNTGFLVFDRLFRHRPIVSISAVQGGGHARPVLRVKNVAPFDIVIERFVVEPEHLGISASQEIRAIIEGIIGADVPILLEPLQQRQLAIIVQDRANLRQDEQIKITIEWRRGVSTWLRQCPIIVRTSLADIELRERAAMNA
jgi:hypothetical protein